MSEEIAQAIREHDALSADFDHASEVYHSALSARDGAKFRVDELSGGQVSDSYRGGWLAGFDSRTPEVEALRREMVALDPVFARVQTVMMAHRDGYKLEGDTITDRACSLIVQLRQRVAELEAEHARVTTQPLDEAAVHQCLIEAEAKLFSGESLSQRLLRMARAICTAFHAAPKCACCDGHGMLSRHSQDGSADVVDCPDCAARNTAPLQPLVRKKVRDAVNKWLDTSSEFDPVERLTDAVMQFGTHAQTPADHVAALVSSGTHQMTLREAWESEHTSGYDVVLIIAPTPEPS